MAAQTMWDRMTPHQRLTAATVDIMNHKDFALLAGVVMLGNVLMEDSFPTAATNGRDCMYGTGFMAPQDRAQTRWVILHENFHKALRHCTEYKDIVEKHTVLSNVAQDFVINAMIDEIDPAQAFAKRPSGVRVLLDKKYYGWSFIQVLRDLLKMSTQQEGGKGKGKPKAGSAPGSEGGTISADEIDVDAMRSFDEHIPAPLTQKELEKLQQDIQDAIHQGKMTVAKMAGKGGGNQALDGITQKRETDWRTPLRQFIEQIIAGYEHSRFVPPNKRFAPLGILMPSHFAETAGEVHVYCDTSGSMMGIYPVVFGEIARIAEMVRPKLMRVIWWDGEVQGEQTFDERNYADMGNAMMPKGGGGTTPECVVRYVAEKGYKPKVGIWLTDGWLDGSNAVMGFPVLWGVVDNENFMPPQGKKINIPSMVRY